MQPVRIYLGGPLFSESEQAYNQQLAERIRTRFKEKVSVYNPQENESLNDKSGYANSIMIAEGDNAYLYESDILIANLDGISIDAGLASEIGVFYMLDRPILGLYTDARQGTYGNEQKIHALDELAESQFSYVNLYTVGLVKKRGAICRSSDFLLDAISDILEGRGVRG